MERILIVTVKLESEPDDWSIDDYALEMEELAATSHAEIVDNMACLRDKPTPNFFIGKGKAEEISALVNEQNIDTVIFSHDITGTQQRNLENIIGRKVIDRTQLILDIFALHAKTPEGKTQVELAQLEYLLPRLLGKGIAVTREGGGIGTRGPGEKKLEIDRRRIRSRIAALRSDLKQLSLHRLNLRKKRKEKSIPSVALVGYTNAGKSTLLNALTGAGQVVQNSLFTTLDPLTKALKLPNAENIVVSDTVGFLYNLPHHLIEAFKATLEEVVDADLLIHVLDVSNPKLEQLNQAVLSVLKDLQVEDKPRITALNKMDQVSDQAWLKEISVDFPNSVVISAKLGTNLEEILAKIRENFQDQMISLKLLLPHARMSLIDLFYRKGSVEKIDYLQKGIQVKVNLPRIIAANILQDKDIKNIC